MAAYRALAQRYHPDKWNGDPTEAHNRMCAINEAYKVIGDKDRRAEYDKSRDSANQSEYAADYDQSQSEPVDPATDAEIKPVEKEAAKISESPMKMLFWFYGLFFGQGLAKYLTRTVIVYPSFTNPDTAGKVAFILTGIVVIGSAWLSGKIGEKIVAKINYRNTAKNNKTIRAWIIGIVAFIPYLFFAALFTDHSNKANTQRPSGPRNLFAELGIDPHQQDESAKRPSGDIFDQINDQTQLRMISQTEFDLAKEYIVIKDWDGLGQYAKRLTEGYYPHTYSWYYLALAGYKIDKYDFALEKTKD